MVDPMNEKGGRVTTFERCSWTFAFRCFYLLLFIQVNLQFFKRIIRMANKFLGEKSCGKITQRYENGGQQLSQE